MATTTYSIRPRPAIRAFGVAAALAVVGAGLAVAASTLGWHPSVTVFGVVLVLGSLALVVAALRAPMGQAVQVELDDAGYRVTGASGDHAGAWREVTMVTQAPGRLTFHQGSDQRFHIIAPHAADQLDAMASDISERLDRARGYRSLD